MIIRYHKTFTKRYKKLGKNLKDKIKQVIIDFERNPKDKSLYNHALKGEMLGKRAIKVTGDVRIIFGKGTL